MRKVSTSAASLLAQRRSPTNWVTFDRAGQMCLARLLFAALPSRATIASMNHDDYLAPDTILHDLGSEEVPRCVLCYDRVASTMDVGRDHLHKQPQDAFPLLVLAEEQTAGRGRMQRPWVAPAGGALLFSLVLRPRWVLPPAQSTALVWLAGVSICEGIAAETPLHPVLKWPNDVLLKTDDGLGKIAGILLESGSSSNRLEWANIGVGLNVSASPPPDPTLHYPATNLAAVLRRPVPRLPLLRAILLRLDSWYTRLGDGDHAELFAAWRDLLATPGQQVRVQTTDALITGLAEDVDASGALHIRDAEGKLHVVTNGDVRA